MKQTLLQFILFTSLTVALHAQTQVSGYILSNTTWTAAGSPYLVTGNTLVINGVTLTIQPGVVVKFDTTKALQIDGELVAIGTPQNRITFTATDPTPVKGSWGRIQFHNSSVDAVFDTAGNYASGSALEYCNVLYGGGIGSSGAVHCDTAAPYFAHCRISESKSAGIYFNYSSNNGVDSSSIRNCTGSALFYNYPSSADLIIRNDTIDSTGGINAYGGGSSGSGYNISFNNAEFYHNVFISNFVSGLQYSGVIGLSVMRCVISNNIFNSNTAAIYSDYAGIINLAGVSYWLVSANTFTSNIVTGHGLFDPVDGGVIFIRGSTAAGTIRDNVFISNNADSLGPAVNRIAVINATGEITHNYFEGNTNVIYCEIFNAQIRCNRFFKNKTSSGRDLIFASGVIDNNVFDKDTALDGSIAQLYYTAEFKGNLVINSSASNKSIITATGSQSIHHNDFTGNSGLSCLTLRNTGTMAIFQNNFLNPAVQYEVNNFKSFGTPDIQADSNYWGNRNAAQIDSVIRDFFDDATLSVVLYPPVLTAPVVVDTTCQTTTACNLTVTGTTIAVSCNGGSNGSINVSVANGASPYTYSWNSGASTQNRSGLTSGTYAVTVVDVNGCSATKSFTVAQPASAPAVVSAVVSDANCNAGGAINITAGGGTGPYTYNWGNGITTEDRTGLNTGNFAVTVTDSRGCTASQSFVIGQAAGPVISGIVTNASCNSGCNGAIDLTITGIAPFTYDWGNGFGASEDTSGLCPGNYNVTVADSNNCGIAAAFTVTSPAALIVTANITSSISCFGYSDGAAMAVANGGTAPYSFLWSDGQTTDAAVGLSVGTYNVTVTDSLGCADTASIAIADGFHVFVGVIVGLNTASLNQHAAYSVNANPSYTYNWSVSNGIIISGQGTNGIEIAWTAAGSGMIQLVAHEQGCADTASKSVTVTDTTRNCSALFYLYPDTVPHAYFVVNTASGISQLSYLWNWGDGTTDTVPYPSHTFSAAGFYTICLTISDSSGCSDTYCNPYFLLKTDDELSAMIQVNVYPPSYTAIHSPVADSVALYPNPTSNIFTLTAPSMQEQVTLILFDALGKEVWQQTARPHELNDGVIIDMSGMREGVYFLNVRTSGGNRVMKVVKY